MEWIRSTEQTPKTSTSMDIYRVLVVYSFGRESQVDFGWYFESTGRWYINGSNSEPIVTHWCEIPKLPVHQ